MTRAYILIFNDAVGTRAQVQSFLDTISEVRYWYSCLPNCIFFTTWISADDMSEKIMRRFGSNESQQHLIVAVSENRQGWLPAKAWQMFSDPRHPEKE